MRESYFPQEETRDLQSRIYWLFGLIVLARHGRNVPMPFGPYLAIAGIIVLFWGKPLSRAVLGV